MNTYSITHCDLVRVVDGDTIVLTIPIWYSTYITVHVRLAGINAPEMPSTEGKAAKHHLQSLVTGKLHILCHGLDKYGRTLGTLWPDGSLATDPSINERMIADGHAKKYELWTQEIACT
jgi:endonuclease YncB( thermonuclease family)